MAFLFKSKKSQQQQQQQQQQQNSALPPATRNIHTSEGAPATTPALNGTKERDPSVSHTPTPSSSYNNSLSSMTNPNSPDQQRLRQRADSESQVGGHPGSTEGF